jgi:membrane-associated phospholipid phosphatase
MKTIRTNLQGFVAMKHAMLKHFHTLHQQETLKILHNVTMLFFLTSFFFSISFSQSPFESTWKKDGIIFAGSIGISLLAASLDDELKPLSINEIAQLKKNEINVFDRWATNFASEKISTASDVLIAACIAAPVGLFFSDKKMRNDGKTLSTMYVETALLATFLPSFGKGTTKRIRPYVYNKNAPLTLRRDIEGERSFFSGHTTWAFASMTFLASVYSAYYPDSKNSNTVWYVSMSAASSVGLFRIFSGAHFPTDVVVGAIVGSAIGIGIPYLHRVENHSISVVPSYRNFGNGIIVRFTI